MTANSPDLETQALQLLCDHPDMDKWSWGGGTDWFSFERNRTGVLKCAGEQWWLAVIGFVWSFDRDTKDAITMKNGDIKCKIQMTLQPEPKDSPKDWNDPAYRSTPLIPTAFLPKNHTITLQTGRFLEPYAVYMKKPFPLFRKYTSTVARYSSGVERYRSRVVFDESPYPSLQEWEARLHGAVEYEYIRYWQRKTFVRDKIEDRDLTCAETLDVSWWLSPKAGEGSHLGY